MDTATYVRMVWGMVASNPAIGLCLASNLVLGCGMVVTDFVVSIQMERDLGMSRTLNGLASTVSTVVSLTTRVWGAEIAIVGAEWHFSGQTWPFLGQPCAKSRDRPGLNLCLDPDSSRGLVAWGARGVHCFASTKALARRYCVLDRSDKTAVPFSLRMGLCSSSCTAAYIPWPSRMMVSCCF